MENENPLKFLATRVDEVVTAVLAAPDGLREEIRFGVSENIVDQELPNVRRIDPQFHLKLIHRLASRSVRRQMGMH